MLLALLFAAEVGAQPNHFRLVCPGATSGAIGAPVVGSIQEGPGRSGTVTFDASKPYYSEATVRIEIDGNKGRATQSNSDYWSDLTEIAITDDEINATVHLRGHPKKVHMRIDRTTGDLAIVFGSVGFHGVCHPAPADQARAF
jgi:hypothetical protein